jgi:hypothetical protein
MLLARILLVGSGVGPTERLGEPVRSHRVAGTYRTTVALYSNAGRTLRFIPTSQGCPKIVYVISLFLSIT